MQTKCEKDGQNYLHKVHYFYLPLCMKYSKDIDNINCLIMNTSNRIELSLVIGSSNVCLIFSIEFMFLLKS